MGAQRGQGVHERTRGAREDKGEDKGCRHDELHTSVLSRGGAVVSTDLRRGRGRGATLY